MKKIVLFLFISINVLAQNGTKNFIDQNYLEVKGIGTLEIVPNIIFLRIGLNEKEVRNKESISEVERKMIAKLHELGIDVKNNLSIKEMSSNFKYYLLYKTEILQSKQFQLVLSDVKTTSKVFVELEKLGISNISIEKVDHTDIISLKSEVKKKAIIDAKNNAETMAAALGQSLGKAIFIQEPQGTQTKLQGRVLGLHIRGMSSLYGSRAPDPENFDIEFEKIEIESTITVIFELK